MIRHVACLAMAMLAGIPLRAGELDKEFGDQTPTVPAVRPSVSKTATFRSAPLVASNGDVKTGELKSSELDTEMPTQAWRRGFGYGGFGRGFGYGGYGYGGFGRGFSLSIGYGGLGYGLGYGGLGYGGYGYGGLGYGGLGYGGLGYGYGGYGGLGYGGLGYGYGGGYALASNYLGYGYGGFPGYYW